MMSQYAAELCALLIEDQFGDLFARIFTTLQRYERLPLPRLKFYSRLTDRQLQHGLVAMIQQHLIFHFTSLEDGNTYYAANPHAAYYLVRSGKILQLVESRLGEYAARVMEAILYLGHAPIKHLETLPELRYLKPETSNGANGGLKQEDEEQSQEQENEQGIDQEPGLEGDQQGEIDTEAEVVETNGANGDHLEEATEKKPAPLHSTLKALASHGYILRVKDAHFQSPEDNYIEAHKAAANRSDIKLLKGKRLTEELANKTDEILRERTEGDLSEAYMINGLPRGLKRKSANGLSDSEIDSKRHTGENGINGNHEYDDEENDWSEDEDGFDSSPMEPSIVVRVNYYKFDVALRNARFVEMAEANAPSATAEIYETFLRRVEYSTKRCRDGTEIPREGEEGEQFSIPIETYKIVTDLDTHLDLSGCMGPSKPPTSSSSEPLNRRGKRPLENGNGVNGDHYDDDHDLTNPMDGADDEVSRAYEVNQHLSLLEQAPNNLVSQVNLSGVVKWRIGFRGLARKLRHLEIERLVEMRYGDVALRVLRVLHAKGKLDEKRLQEISLLPFKDLRQTLASMQTGGFVDLQEVPKDAQRQPSKTIFLWYFDPDRVCSTLLEDTYKAMSRTLQRIKFERSQRRDFLEKTERSDIKGNEERWLSEGELEQLRRWKDMEALLLGVVSRLDDMVAVFRDF
ncbi:DNA-directed RNA polymerase III subunit rpc3 [Penicillium oxalicum]|uniref:DNA-directed RNA polymerase III subunit rpc3 n=1 Tax=Penicillium oxalicum TaxID=69781 RepID=UPI0020B70A80|nr:DNA-directed RNA polymerase III subunit rpc3 [Penicillium oxalicum]KAI2794266.1 DNA-directed RNA polymerase III subunit rpc3 [Penicillium oxalicum]